jgi:hypothetical protein
VGGTLTANGLLSAAGSSTLDGLPTSAVFGGTKRVVAGYSTSSDYGFLASVDNGVGWKDLWLNPSGGSIKAGGQLIQVADPATLALWKDSTPTKAARFQFNTLADNGFSLGVYDGSSWFNAITVAPTTGVVKVPSTSASVSTVTGALLVGNGTSGGLGVGGAGYFGGLLNISSTAGLYAQWKKTDNASGSQSWAWIANNDGTLFLQAANDNFVGANNYLSFARSGVTPGTTTIHGTTASTSTSSGALVVGNGTSGGLGVGGNAYIGGDLVVPTGGKAIYSQGYVTVKDLQVNLLSRGTNNGWTTGLHFYSSNTDYSATFLHNPASGDLLVYSNATSSNYTASDIALKITTAKQVQVPSSTASTSTSSGALVVSGGVGVAKRIFTGEGLDTAGDNATHISLVRNGTISIGPTSAATPKLQVGGGLLLANTSQSVPAYGDVGPQLSVAGAVITDTSSSGTVSRAVVNSIAASALAASSTTTYTAAASLFVAGAPTANTNVTITNAYAIYTAGGRINFQGLPTSSAGLQAGTLWNDGGTLKIA